MCTVTVWHRRGCGPCEAVIRDVVPELREEGVEVVLMDVHRHPCAARDARIAYLPTLVAEGDGPRVTCRGYPDERAVRALVADGWRDGTSEP